MLKLVKKIVQILDDTPAVYGERQKGQSVVELALITPILIVLLSGLIEIGWFANNYLTLLDVSRAGARRGTVLQDTQSPLFWDNTGSIVPQFYFNSFADGDVFKTDFNLNGLTGESDATRVAVRFHPDHNPTACSGIGGATRQFYSEISCVVTDSLDPLYWTPENGQDDLVISGFGLENVDGSRESSWLGTLGTNPRPIAADVPQLVVAARYPTNANECDVAYDSETGTTSITAQEARDPFDINYSRSRDIDDANTTVDGVDDFTEIDGGDYLAALPGTLGAAEKQVGFVLFGNHRIAGTGCVGSEWTMNQVEAVVNLSAAYDMTGTDAETIIARRMIPGQGIILVEIFWQHRLLLNLPVLAPVYTALGSDRTTISVWAAFPLPAAEPFILFD
ncbi:MAG: pilus assembly protein [Anaerolinea sp.]|nr:pilus assembly protein [Anaerolinea sp.]